ncbi:LysR family transcriptional regulator [Variovorax sp. H27-G14]|uniref:LysR family transcriptional regulator n=1 Tax=Variovorax sp. H27-G14 TaxID=3111914 RepID=UPI0038FC3EC9
MNLSLDQLVVFVAAAREKSFSATARTLRKAQSAVSTAIGDLEIDLGVTLFDRTGRYPVLTPAGEALLTEADAILSHCNSLRERASVLTTHFETSVTIGIEDAFPCEQIAPVLTAFHKRFPGVEINIVQPSKTDLLTMVQNGEAMLGLGCARAHYPQGMEFCRLGHVTLVNAVHQNHPLSRTRDIRFSQLADHLQLLLEAQSKHLLTSEYLKSPKRVYVQSSVALLQLLKSGLGWSIVAKWLIASELAAGDLVEMQLKAYPFTKWTVGLDFTWRTEAKTGAVSTWLKTELSRTRIFC